MSPTLLLVGGLTALAVGLLVLTLALVPAGRPRVPLNRLDPTVAQEASALAGAGAAAGAVVERVLVKRGRLAAGADALERAGMSTTLPNFVLAVGIWCFCRAYYFAFYVIEHYIDPGYKFAGLSSFVRYLLRRR